MNTNKSDVLQGTLSLLVLKVLARGPLHGYAITNRIQQISADALRVEEGSLYPALHRMEQDQWIQSEWGQSETGRRARIYSLTPIGHEQLAKEEQSWERLTVAVAAVLRLA